MRNKKINISKTALKAMFLAFALIMGIVERWIPFEFIVPGVKLGLANVVVLTSLYLFSWGDALKISLLKCILTAIFVGFGISFFYSLGGAIFSFLAMTFLIWIGCGKISPIGVSVAGAVFHNFGQILIASLVMKTIMVAAYLPILLISGVITGIIVGIIVNILVKYISLHITKL